MDINVTQPFLPDLSLYQKYLKKIWSSHQLTNGGPLSLLLEKKLKKYFGVKYLFFTANGTIALQIAIRALDLKGEIITTPFTYVATANSIVWEHCTPVFVDINEFTMTIDPTLIEKAITPKTSAIMGVHVYGYPCDVEAIEAIAKKHNLKVIYDSAHAFGTIYQNKALVGYGDISTLSFHATKLFHTAEGGAIITNNDDLAKKIMLYRAFGHTYDTYHTFGINGKNSELHAAMGLSIFPSLSLIIKKLHNLCEIYDTYFKNTKLSFPYIDSHTVLNHAYYPVVFPTESLLLQTIKALQKNSIYPRRYFYPALNTLPFLNETHCPNAESIASRVLCLPLYANLPISSVRRIATIVQSYV